MSSHGVPSKVEVLGWSPQSLAGYMKTLKLPGCDALVIKNVISGADFMGMTMWDLSVFPSLYVPLVTKIQSDINKGNQTKAFGLKSEAQKYPKQVIEEEEEDWESDESEGPDPSWYAGEVTRQEAEVALREVNKDGAFVVRRSSQGAAEQPYTLMLLKRGRVYNVMVRRRGGRLSLGTGIKRTKSFPGLEEMITHHTHTPLQFSDGTDPCCLLHPLGL
ncbi:Cytokine-dependent hematopoietic cell linker [Liparis tanakae]|uniref:Cytokine-dependent hematopoietic cell linker n=1 Tax=Liparis tanakae TaxID=230148 RepID=A0A4Z2F4R3_9TELE|nr:Cytokine-dependent hematopoietic cell linker [Liparis tanakae]